MSKTPEPTPTTKEDLEHSIFFWIAAQWFIIGGGFTMTVYRITCGTFDAWSLCDLALFASISAYAIWNGRKLYARRNQ